MKRPEEAKLLLRQVLEWNGWLNTRAGYAGWVERARIALDMPQEGTCGICGRRRPCNNCKSVISALRKHKEAQVDGSYRD